MWSRPIFAEFPNREMAIAIAAALGADVEHSPNADSYASPNFQVVRINGPIITPAFTHPTDRSLCTPPVYASGFWAMITFNHETTIGDDTYHLVSDPANPENPIKDYLRSFPEGEEPGSFGFGD